MRRVDYLMTEARTWAENLEYGLTEGISDYQLLSSLRNASRMLQETILRNIVSCELFDEQYTFTTVAFQRAYGLPGATNYAGTPATIRRPFMGSSLRLVEYTYTGVSKDYYPLDLKVFRELSNIWSTPPIEYGLLADQLYLSPVPNTSGKTTRVTLITKADVPDLPRATVSVAHVSGDYYDYITLSGVTSGSEDETALSQATHICINETFDGTAIYRNIPGSYSTSTAKWTPTTNSCPTATATITAGDTVTVGKDSSQFPDPRFPEEAERYLVAYMIWKMFKHDSSTNAIEQGNELQIIESSLLESIGCRYRDAMYNPILDEGWMK